MCLTKLLFFLPTHPTKQNNIKNPYTKKPYKFSNQTKPIQATLQMQNKRGTQRATPEGVPDCDGRAGGGVHGGAGGPGGPAGRPEAPREPPDGVQGCGPSACLAPIFAVPQPPLPTEYKGVAAPNLFVHFLCPPPQIPPSPEGTPDWKGSRAPLPTPHPHQMGLWMMLAGPPSIRAQTNPIFSSRYLIVEF